MPLNSLLFKWLTRIGLTSLLLGVSSPSYSAQIEALVGSEDCNPVGRVVSIANSQLPEGQLLCARDKIRILPNKRLKFACYSTGQELTLSQGGKSADEYCGGVSYRSRRCTNQNPVNCINVRNPNISVRATLFVPYSSTVMGGRPDFLWEAEPGAEAYTIELIFGSQRVWKQTVTSNSMAYPAESSPLESGKAYLVRVSATRGTQVISENTSVLNRLSVKKLATLKSTFASIDALSVPKIDKILDKDKIYISQGLLSESIEILKAQLQQDQTNPVLHRHLGDRYMNAGLPKEAQPYFLEAEFLAKEEQDTFELSKAQEGLAEIVAIPTQTSGPATNQ